MRFFRGFVGAVLVAALFAVPVSADRGSWNNWHVHDGTAGTPPPDANGLKHRGAVFFPTIFTGGDVAAYIADPSLWAYCTDATDKGLVGGTGGAKFAAGQCRNEDNIIHLQVTATSADAQTPAGWTSFQWGTDTVSYLLTPR